MRKSIISAVLILTVISWQCSKLEQNLTLRESVEHSSAKINTAFEKISESPGYRLLSVTEDGTKTDFSDGFRDSIDLDLIAGVYDFKPDFEKPRNFFFPFRLFKKTAESEKMIVNLPEKLVFHPKYLHFCVRNDTALKNNFTITASDYHFYFNWWNNHDYGLTADFSKDSEEVGRLEMFSVWKSALESSNYRSFEFPEGYTVLRSHETGDTSKIVFALAHDRDTILMETLMFYGEGFKRKEKLYILSIGNVDIVRGTGIDSIQVFLDGVLQKEAGAKIIDGQDINGSICHKRDIQLTFDDGTTANLSELIAPARETMRSLSKSLVEIYFAKQIVDYIAFSIYYNSH